MPRRGLTLVELIVVLAICVALAALVLPLVGEAPRDAQATATKVNMVQVRDAYVRFRIDNPFRADGLPLFPDQVRLGDLFNPTSLPKPWDPVAKTGWHGPYLKPTGAQFAFTGDWAAFGTAGGAAEDCLPDSFNHADGVRRPLVLRFWSDGSGTTIVWVQCAGSDGVLRNVPADGPPTPVDNGTLFAGVLYDDLTLQVYP